MNELLILKNAAAEIDLDPSTLRHSISAGELPADKHGGRDWWIRRGDLVAYNERRRPVGPPRGTPEDEAQERARAYRREYQRQYRARLREEAAGADKAEQKRSAKNTRARNSD